MEILFVWFYKEKMIEEQGFNFSPKYKFKVDKEGEKYILTCNYNKDSINIFKLDKNLKAIQNITAIIGENGTGKTTLLQGLCEFYLPIELKEERIEYKDFKHEKSISNRKIIVIKEENEIIIYHNIQSEYFENKTKYKALVNNPAGNIDATSNITKIYCTNSNYNYERNGYVKETKLSNCFLNLDTLEILAKNFYRKLININNNNYITKAKLEEWKNYNKLIINQKKANNFQELCDVLYYKYLKDNRLKEDFDDSLIIYKDLYIDSKGISKSDLDGKNKSEYKFIYESTKDLDLRDKDKSVINKLYFHLLLELIIYNNTNEYEYENLSEFKELIEYEIKKVDNNVLSKYFKNANCEIEKLEKILKNSIPVNQNLPIHDVAYNFSRIIEKSNSKPYGEFLDFINECYNNEHSFILKYISIGNLQMSSGERACLNIFSWLNLMPQFSNIDPTIPRELKDNILILIDELDLYIHPEWQRKAIKILINELENQFKDYKIQVILATHSPIILSDIPNDNIIYLNKDVNKMNKSNIINSKTFGANIYSLYKENFFFDVDYESNGKKYFGIIGEYASNKIEYVIEVLDKSNEFSYFSIKEQKEYEKELIDCKKIINLIGESFIRNMLNNKYEMAEKVLKQDDNSKINESIENFNKLSEKDRRKFIKYIINQYK